MEHAGKKGKLLDQIDDSRSAPSTSRSKVKSPHKERENFRSTLVNVIMWVLPANQRVTSGKPWEVTLKIEAPRTSLVGASRPCYSEVSGRRENGRVWVYPVKYVSLLNGTTCKGAPASIWCQTSEQGPGGSSGCHHGGWERMWLPSTPMLSVQVTQWLLWCWGSPRVEQDLVWKGKQGEHAWPYPAWVSELSMETEEALMMPSLPRFHTALCRLFGALSFASFWLSGC